MILVETLLSFVATLGFGIIFNIHGKNLFFASVGGAISWFVYALSLKFNLSVPMAMFVAAVAFSIYSEILARKLKTPVTTLVLTALIPLVPGSGMYYTMYQVVTGDIDKALELCLNTIASAGALALGVIFVSTITRRYYSVKMKLKKSKKLEE